MAKLAPAKVAEVLTYAWLRAVSQLEGQGLFRYGDRVHEIRPGDCISCPADTGIAHQIANPATSDGTDDLVYLAIGTEPPGKVCTYPDSDALVIDGLGRRGFLSEAGYYEGQPEPTPLLTPAL